MAESKKIQASKTESKIAVITGITGQDGSYLGEFLHAKGYEVHGISRNQSSVISRSYTDAFHNVKFHYGVLQDEDFVNEIIRSLRPSEIYNLAGQTHVAESWNEPVPTCETNGIGLLVILDAVRKHGLINTTRIFQPVEVPQTECTPFAPTTPYATSKVFAYWIAINYRQHYGMFVTNGILFNHESSRRGHGFLTWTLTHQIAELAAGKRACVLVGDLSVQRDWGHAPDYVEGMWRTLQQHQSDDFVFATGQKHTLREFVEIAFKVVGINISWEGEGIEETGKDSISGDVILRINPKFYGVASNRQLGDPSKIFMATGWKSRLPFSEMVREIVDVAIQEVKVAL